MPTYRPSALALLDDAVDVLEVVLVRLRRVVVDERRVAVGVGVVEAVELGEDDRLDDREPVPRGSRR